VRKLRKLEKIKIGILVEVYQQDVDINKEYRLKETSYFKSKFKKTQIVIGNSFNKGMNHFDIWNKKISGKFKGTSPYTIDLQGRVFEHYDPTYYSTFLRKKEFDKKVISIVLENEGWLIKDFNKKTHIMWDGDIYNRIDPLVERKWRGKLRWAPYSDKQMESLALLCDKLTDEFKIPKIVSSDNIKLNEIASKSGVFYRGNYSKKFLDVSPAFNFNYLKTKIEK
tara:strand:- start:18729 stop:19400 length:672 start_codon:yes stop_codon:yes gene_type:complete